MSGNSIGGTIPVELYNLTHMESLELSDMNLTGTLSSQIGKLGRLYNLRLRRNMLSGTIPTELASLQQLRKSAVLLVMRHSRVLFTHAKPTGLAWFHFIRFEGAIPDSICSLVVPFGVLEFLQADCGPEDNPAQVCSCCSACCDRENIVSCYKTSP